MTPLWLRRAVPFAAAGAAVAVAAFVRPFAPQAWGVVMMPAVVVATWTSGWRGGSVAIGLGMVGWILFIAPPPWLHPISTIVWLIAHSAAIVAMDLFRQTRHELREAKAVQREQAMRAARAVAARRAAFLAHASEVLASSPDYETTLAAVANLAVPQIADLCVVDILGDDGSFTPLAIAHADPQKAQLVRELRQMYPLDTAAKYGPPRVLRAGRSQVFTEVTETGGGDPTVDPADSRVAVALGIHSTMAVPLLVGGRKLGVISFATTDSGRRFVEADLMFAEDLARRAAIAIDTARP